MDGEESSVNDSVNAGQAENGEAKTAGGSFRQYFPRRLSWKERADIVVRIPAPVPCSAQRKKKGKKAARAFMLSFHLSGVFFGKRWDLQRKELQAGPGRLDLEPDFEFALGSLQISRISAREVKLALNHLICNLGRGTRRGKVRKKRH